MKFAAIVRRRDKIKADNGIHTLLFNSFVMVDAIRSQRR